jgi:hypothetical protein
MTIGDPGEHIEHRGYVVIAQQKSLFGAYFEVNVSSNEPALLLRLPRDARVIRGKNRAEAIEAAKRRIDEILA